MWLLYSGCSLYLSNQAELRTLPVATSSHINAYILYMEAGVYRLQNPPGTLGKKVYLVSFQILNELWSSPFRCGTLLEGPGCPFSLKKKKTHKSCKWRSLKRIKTDGSGQHVNHGGHKSMSLVPGGQHLYCS